MTYIFIGYILTSFEITANNVSLLPDFLGYVLIALGANQLKEESIFFGRMIPLSIGMAIYTSIHFLAALLGWALPAGILMLVLAMVSLLVSLYISYNMIRGITEMEDNRGYDFSADKLMKWWMATVFLAVFNSIFGFTGLEPLIMVGTVLSMVVNVMFLASLYSAKVLIEARRK
jgi:hypothetical protein